MFNSTIPNYGWFRSLVRGEGSHVWDAEWQPLSRPVPGWGCGLLALPTWSSKPSRSRSPS